MLRVVPAVITVGALIAAGTIVAAADNDTAAKTAHIAVPEYVVSYWPDAESLCVLDRTDGLPVAEAATEFAGTAMPIHVSEQCGNRPTVVAVTVDEPDADWAGWTVPEDGGYDDSGRWVIESTVLLRVNTHSELSRDEWRLLLTHELGHAVGLDHTNRRDSIMNNEVIYEQDGLTKTDRLVIGQLYAEVHVTTGASAAAS